MKQLHATWRNLTRTGQPQMDADEHSWLRKERSQPAVTPTARPCRDEYAGTSRVFVWGGRATLPSPGPGSSRHAWHWSGLPCRAPFRPEDFSVIRTAATKILVAPAKTCWWAVRRHAIPEWLRPEGTTEAAVSLTRDPSPQGEGGSRRRRRAGATTRFKSAPPLPPLPGGEGRGEGKGTLLTTLHARCCHLASSWRSGVVALGPSVSTCG
jgi:hypothetical protein